MKAFIDKITVTFSIIALLFSLPVHSYEVVPPPSMGFKGHNDVLMDFQQIPQKLDVQKLMWESRRVWCSWKKPKDCLKKLERKVIRPVVKVTEKIVKETAETTVEIVEDTAEGVGKVGKVAGNVLEAAGNYATGDDESAKRALDRLEENGRDAVRKFGSAGSGVIEAGGDILIDAPLEFTAVSVDILLNTDGHFLREVEDVQADVSREIRRGTRKMGAVLEVAAQPENLGKIAVIYMATAMGGPFGAALANTFYDKVVLKKDMSDSDMLKSFAIGMAAGYAAQGAQGWIEGSAVEGVETFRHASYASKAASSMAQNLTTDAGNIVLNGESYTSRDFILSLTSGLSSVEAGDSFASQVLEETLQGGLRSASTQVVEEEGLDIDFDRVEMATYQGFSYGITRESVHSLLDHTIMPHLPKNMDKKAFTALKESFYKLSLGFEERGVETFIDSLKDLSPEDRDKLLKQVNSWKESLGDTPEEEFFKEMIDPSKSSLSKTLREIFGEDMVPVIDPLMMVLAYGGNNYERVEELGEVLRELYRDRRRSGESFVNYALKNAPLAVSSAPSEVEVSSPSPSKKFSSFVKISQWKADEGLRIATEGEPLGYDGGIIVVGEDRERIEIPLPYDNIAFNSLVTITIREDVSAATLLGRVGLGELEDLMKRHSPAELPPLNGSERVEILAGSFSQDKILSGLHVEIGKVAIGGGISEIRDLDDGKVDFVGDFFTRLSPSLASEESDVEVSKTELFSDFPKRAQALRDKLETALVFTNEERVARDVGLWAVDMAIHKYSNGDALGADILYKYSILALDVALSYAPYTGTFKDGYEFFMGVGFISQEILESLDRAFAGIGLTISLGTGGIVSSGPLKSSAQTMIKLAKNIDPDAFSGSMRFLDNLDEVEDSMDEVIYAISNMSDQADDYITRLEALGDLPGSKMARIVRSYDGLSGKMVSYANETGLPVQKHTVTRTIRQNADGTLTEADVFSPGYTGYRTGDGRFVLGGERGNVGLHGSVDTLDGPTALETSRAEVSFSPKESEDLITATQIIEAKTLDLTDAEVRGRLGILEDELKILRRNNPRAYEKTQQIGDIAKNLGYEAIVYPSIRKDRGKNIVILKEELLK